ncbi:uncharacterized protein LOC108922233 [Arapaima gigas]
MHGDDCDDSNDSDSAPYFPCHVCGKTFTTSESLEDHQRCHLGEKPHECEECGKCFFQLAHLQQHQRSHKSEFQCQTCGRGFVSLFALRKHKHSHGKSRPYRCPRCQLSFTGPAQLAEHMATHGDDNFPCDLCDRTFSCRLSRVQHRMSHTEPEESLPPLLPPAAKGLTAQPVALSQQIEEDEVEVDVGEDFYNCPDCGKRFPSKASLEEHQRQHAPERRFKCLVCNKFFAKKRYLKKHEVIHQRTNRRSGSSQTIGGAKACVVHQQEHGDAERRQSSVCLKNAVVPQGLLHHRKTQSERTDEIGGDFRCDMCYRSFNQLSLLRQHQETHVGQVVYECTECDKAFAFFHLLEEHQSTHSVVTPSSASSLD